MVTYTLVVRVPDEMSQDALIEAVDGDIAGAEVVFCGPGSLVEIPPVCEGCGEVVDFAHVADDGRPLCDWCTPA